MQVWYNPEMAKRVGATFDLEKRIRSFNTPDAHRLLHLRIAAQAGLDARQARQLLDSDRYAETGRQDERRCQAGITAVPSVVFNQQHLLQGGQRRAPG